MFGIGKSIETESRLSGHWGWKKREWRVTANRYGVNLGALKCSRISGDSCTSYELYTLKGWTLWHMYYISRKPLFKKNERSRDFGAEREAEADNKQVAGFRFI